MEEIEIFTDGACRGNPGPGGWGAILRCGEKVKTLRGAVPDTTNNRMELQAAIEGLASLKRACQVTLTTDSVYVQRGMREWIVGWKRKQWRSASGKPVKNVDLWQQLDAASQPHQINWCWVKGHSGHAENEWADRLANEAIDDMLRDGETL